jgi:hypothetical protein
MLRCLAEVSAENIQTLPAHVLAATGAYNSSSIVCKSGWIEGE